MDLLLQRSLSWVWSCRSSWLVIQWKSLTQACSSGCHWFWFALAEVTGSGLLPRCPWLWPAPLEVACSGLVLQWSLARVCSHGCPCFGPAPTEVAGLKLVHEGCLLRPGPVEDLALQSLYDPSNEDQALLLLYPQNFQNS